MPIFVETEESKTPAWEGDVDKAVAEHHTKIAELDMELKILRELVDDDVTTIKNNVNLLGGRAGACVQADGYDRIHRIAVGPPAAPIRWKTKCGWAFASSSYQVVEYVDESRCGTCFRTQESRRSAIGK